MRSLKKDILQPGALLAAFLLLFLLPGCIREENPPPPPTDPEAIRRDSITKVLINDINSDSIRASVAWLESFGTRFALASNRKKVAESIRDRFKRNGITDARIDSFEVTLNYYGTDHLCWQYNVIAHLHGNMYADQLSIAGAHYDDIVTQGDPYTFAPGANDNASGVAVTLEVARVMAKNKYKPQGSINFVAFAAEEFDLQGSRYYVHDAEIHEDKIIMMINNDMVGFETGTKVLSWQMTMTYYDNSHSLLQDAINYCWLYADVAPIADNTNAKKSDSYPFYLGNRQAVYFASRQSDPNYHSIRDRTANLNFEYCRRLANLSCAMLVYKN